ncbi:MAG TPA: helix-turn-helix domain-containing protein, partial [Gemmatimonadaceae bacterium]|nr:helix-turn-helix domain-containing protein [Gemmatimonadaceae bacterium]
LALLQRAAWPGNVRELEHAVERAVILSPSPLLAPSAFDGQRFGLADAGLPAGATGTPAARTLDGAGPADPDAIVLRTLNVNEAERILIEHALERAGNNRTKAAELLGMSVRTLRNKLNG